jgi:serine/threonine protein kinase
MVVGKGKEALPFARLGHFRILCRIGRGGMGDVYRGYDDTLDRAVAVKVLPSELARDEDFVRRFHAEATAAAKIAHPNVVPNRDDISWWHIGGRIWRRAAINGV